MKPRAGSIARFPRSTPAHSGPQSSGGYHDLMVIPSWCMLESCSMQLDASTQCRHAGACQYLGSVWNTQDMVDAAGQWS